MLNINSNTLNSQMRYYFSPTRRAEIRLTTLNIGENAEQLEVSYTAKKVGKMAHLF